jgi:hypothetical protein
MINNDYPTEIEVRYCLKLIGCKEDVGLSTRIMSMMWGYVNGLPLETIQKTHGCTFERVRQCLIKGCKIAYEL